MRIPPVAMMTLLAGCGGTAAATCDSAQLSTTCKQENGQCVEFSGLSSADNKSVSTNCTVTHGVVISGLCDTANRVGTCVIPAEGRNTGVTCSPNGHIAIRFFSPFSAADAQTQCQAVAGATWTPN